MSAPHSGPPPAGLPRSPFAVVSFCVLSYALAWAVASPMWFSGQGLDHPHQRLILQAMMLTPALAAVIVLVATGHRRDILRVSALVPFRPAGRILRYCLYGLLVAVPVTGGGLLLAAAAGGFRLDLADFSGFRELAGPMGLVDPDGSGAPWGALALFGALQLGGLLLSVPALLGEEWGWRGYLLPALLPMGTWPALMLHGAVWGAWHAPAVLLGYNLGRTDLLGVAMMTAWGVLLGVIIGWLRLASGSVWPAVVGHGSINVASAWPIVFGDAGSGIAEASALPMPLWYAMGAAMLALVGAGAVVQAVRSRRSSGSRPDARGGAGLARL
ncbi:CPBP family intramembrane metalloprotease [Nocardiopsis sp. RSe5-2]|uniref:CPBP family intramembrane metalloprotease n=1 Tax=Nocardiopsis endophytica TaxID=3018445 RepID=A0ABT4U286_9ACTN|nr:CPBP family intramembrane glutamic endopeptidase [Nocardiopsis endophytica]MDA2811049.1 CPBP family intramembrane metalloprotease [Nocardiopsis endophytica]